MVMKLVFNEMMTTYKSKLSLDSPLSEAADE